MLEFQAVSGATVKINVADWEDAINLKDAVERELKNLDVTVSMTDINSVKAGDMTEYFKAVMALDSSLTVRAALLKCLSKCTYNGQSITMQTFQPVDARADYYDIVLLCMKENLSVFITGLLSQFTVLISRLGQANENLPAPQ